MIGTRELVVACAILSLSGCLQRHVVFEIPEGFTGWVEVHYDSPTCDEGDITLGRHIIQVDPRGGSCSRSWHNEGRNLIRFYYGDHAGRRVQELKSKGWRKGGEIWAPSITPATSRFRFFVGDQKTF